jgi:hypothetical protein
MTPADLIVPALLFIILTPGVILTLPSSTGGLLFSGQTGIVPVIVHAVIFSILYATLRGIFPRFY